MGCAKSTKPLSRTFVAILCIGIAPLSHGGQGETPAPTDAEVANALRDLQSKNMQTRRDALDVIAHSGDPRIPKACLPLLRDPGDSIRYLAARAIGSRWSIISKSESPVFLDALRKALAAEEQTEPQSIQQQLMQRAIGLISRSYEGVSFSRSPDQRWVIHERRALPAVIDTTTGTEQLLSPTVDGEVITYLFTPPALAHEAKWSPDSKQVALPISTSRHTNALCIWTPAEGRLQTLEPSAVVAELGLFKDQPDLVRFLTLSVEGWRNGEALCRVSGYADEDIHADFRFNPATATLKRR